MTKKVSVHVVSITPFDARGELDEPGLRLHLQRLAAAGLTVHLAGSGSGEGNVLTAAETRRVFEIGVEELKGRVPVRAMGVEPRTARQLIDLVELAQDVGLDGMQVYGVDMGHGVAPTDHELERYFGDVLSRLKIPALISIHHNIGYLVPLPVLDRLVKRFENVIGVIATTPDVSYLTRLVDLLAPRIEVNTAAPYALNVLSLGGHGIGISEGNLAPKLCGSFVDHYNAGRLREAQEMFAAVLRLYAANSRYGSIRGVKAALNMLGLPGGDPRPPRLPLPAEERADIACVLEALRIREIEGLA